MATAHADAWHESGLRGERPTAPPRRTPPPPPPPLPPLPGMAGRSRSSRPVPAEAWSRSPDRGPADRRRPSVRDDRGRDDRARSDSGLRDDLQRSRPSATRPPADPHRGRGPARGNDRWDEDPRAERSRDRDGDRSGSRRPPTERPASQEDGRRRGSVAVLGIFLTTLAGGAADSFLDVGLGMITLVALVASTAVATLLVRRRDLLSVVLAPPLVFVAVAGLNIALAPSVSLSLPTVATLLIRGFPTMAVATAAAMVLALVRLVSRR